MSVSKRSSEYSVRLLSSEYTFTKYVCLSVNEALRIVSDCYVTTCSGNISVSDQSSKCIVLLRIVNTCSTEICLSIHTKLYYGVRLLPTESMFRKELYLSVNKALNIV